MRRALLAAVAAVLALTTLSACGSETSGPGEARVDVHTQELRQLKADAGIETCRPGRAEPVDGGLPDVTLPCLGGGPDVALGSLRGPLVVNVWASWCGPCRQEMPAVADFYRRYGDRVPVIGIDFQDVQTGPALELAKRSRVTYPLLADLQGELPGRSPFPARMPVPSFAFVDADGRATLEIGGISSSDELADLVRKHLGVDL